MSPNAPSKMDFRPRLSREDVKTRLEVELDVRNECVVPNFADAPSAKRWS